MSRSNQVVGTPRDAANLGCLTLPPSDAPGWRLREFSGTGYDKGRGWLAQATWFAFSNLVFKTWWCPARFRPAMLRAFGAEVGARVLIRHNVRVHWPWKLTIGDDCWLGEDVWLLNLEPITLGADVCVSQGAFLCTGSHDRRSPSFEYDNGPIIVREASWIAAQAIILRGVTVEARAVVGARAVVMRDVPAASLVAPCALW
jgi:putative colanic acid biosynthesis acetyltransferase WcaF